MRPILTDLAPLYRYEADDARQRADVVEARSYILWFIATNYAAPFSLYA